MQKIEQQKPLKRKLDPSDSLNPCLRMKNITKDFFGIDCLPHEGYIWVKNDILEATFLYPTPGEKGLEIALDILEGKKDYTW